MIMDFNASNNFFKKMLNLAEYLNESSRHFLQIIRDLNLNEIYSRQYLKENTEILIAINYRSQLIKEEIVETAVHYHDDSNNNERFKNYYLEMKEDLEKIYSVWDQISNSSYCIDEQGILTKKGAAQNEPHNSDERRFK